MAVYPSPHGEDYSYVVDKYWIVTRELDDRMIEVRTRRGKVHRVRRDDPHLRKAHWLDRLIHGSLFPELSRSSLHEARA
jgi:hypothetical protein